MDLNGHSLLVGAGKYGIYNDKSDVTIKNGTIAGSGTKPSTDILLWRGINNTTIENVTMKDASDGILMGAGAFTNLTLSGNTFINNSDYGLTDKASWGAISIDGLVMTNNTFTDNGYDAAELNDVTNITAANNVINGGAGFGIILNRSYMPSITPSMFTCNDVPGCLVLKNIQAPAATRMVVSDYDLDGHSIASNFIQINEGSANITVKNNTLTHFTDAGIIIGGGDHKNLTIQNNTITSSKNGIQIANFW